MATPNQPTTAEPTIQSAAAEAAPGTSNGASGPPGSDPGTKLNAANGMQSRAPELMSQEEYDQKNKRRGALIFKETRQGLTHEEQSELAQLQDEVGAWVDARFPLPPVNTELLEELARCLGTSLDLPKRE